MNNEEREKESHVTVTAHEPGVYKGTVDPLMAKLWELSVDMANSYDGAGVCVDFSDRLDDILSTEPADPVKVDVEAVRNAEDASRFNFLITMLPVGTFNDRDVFNRDSWIEAIDAAMQANAEVKG